MFTCAANTSPLVALSSVGRLDLLRAVFPQVLMPGAVFHEVVTDGVGWAEAGCLQREIATQAWIVQVEPPASALLDSLRTKLGGSGEAEAIVIAREREVPVLLDEMAGRRAAAGLGLRVVGSLWVLRQAKQAGLIGRIQPLVAEMREAGIYYHDDLVERFLREVGEL
jgi:predicted nucleic acid-binding protein